MEITTKNMRAILINVLLGLATVAAVFVAIGGGWSIAKYTGILPLKKAKKALVIEKTPISIENVRAIGELVTANYYDETVSIMGKVWDRIPGGSSEGKDTTVLRVRKLEEKEQNTDSKKGNELVLIQTVHARIGVDLSELKENDLKVSEADKSVELFLPDVKCLDFITNPSNTEIFSEKGTWTLEDLKVAMIPASEEMRAKMNDETRLFDTARQGVEEVVTQLFQAAGYQTVKVIFNQSNTQALQLPPVEQ